MKQLPLFLLVIFLLTVLKGLAFQQNPLVRIEEWQKHSTEDRLLNCRETHFEYDEFGNEILRKGFVWSTVEQ